MTSMNFEEYAGRSEELARAMVRLANAHTDAVDPMTGGLIRCNAISLAFAAIVLAHCDGDVDAALAMARASPFESALAMISRNPL